MSSKKKKVGMSLRTIHVWLIAGAIVLSALMFFSTYDLSSSYRNLTAASERHIEFRKDAIELMDASDYLTECVQRFSLKGDTRFLDGYFNEALEARHRENAIEKMSSAAGFSTAALEKLHSAMEKSVKLMAREYYSMRLVVEAKGYASYPEELNSVILSDEDIALAPEEKMRRANEIVLDDEYYSQKKLIHDDLQNCLNELEKAAIATDVSAQDTLHDEIIVVRIVIVLQTAGLIFLVWLASRLGIHPILDAVDRIKSDSKLQEVGAKEFRYLVRAYNKMYENYKSNMERLSFRALHDELTGVYNRAGFRSIVSEINMSHTYLILFDVDNFKRINDTYGHETGDRVLMKIVQALKHNFRTNDYICRLGGDEFVVFMVNTPDMQTDLVASKITAVNKELEKADDGLPPVSISVGVVHGDDSSRIDDLLKKTDEAMYESKQKGKRTFTFYNHD